MSANFYRARARMAFIFGGAVAAYALRLLSYHTLVLPGTPPTRAPLSPLGRIGAGVKRSIAHAATSLPSPPAQRPTRCRTRCAAPTRPSRAMPTTMSSTPCCGEWGTFSSASRAAPRARRARTLCRSGRRAPRGGTGPRSARRSSCTSSPASATSSRPCARTSASPPPTRRASTRSGVWPRRVPARAPLPPITATAAHSPQAHAARRDGCVGRHPRLPGGWRWCGGHRGPPPADHQGVMRRGMGGPLALAALTLARRTHRS